MKKLIGTLVAFAIAICPLSGSAGYLYSRTNTKKINNAITYEHKQMLTPNGWIRAYVAYVDIKDANASVKVLTSDNGASYLSTVRQMAKSSGASLAINGDFFNFASGQTNMLGMTYQDGKLISSPAIDNMVSMAITEDNQIIMDYFSFSSTVTSPQGYTCPVYQINKMPVDTGAITMLTSDWAAMTPGEGFEALIVENDTVKEIKQADSAAVAMPKNGYALVTNPWINAFFDNFAIGDVVTVETIITPDIDGIKEATGGNTLIVDGGKVCNFTSNVTGYAQRSAAGVTADASTLILAATDGREATCRGLTQTELANLMIELGAHKAINLDGGGSTTFAMKEADGSYSVKNKVSSERKVSTSIGVFSAGFVGDKASRGELSASQSVILKGDSVRFDAVFYEQYENVFAHNAATTQMYDQNGAPVPFEGYSPAPGKHTIYAKLGDALASCEVEVIDSLFAIEASADTLSLEAGKSAQLSVYGYGNNGQRTTINPALVDWISSSDEVSVSKGKLTSKSGGGAIVTVRYGDVMDFVNVNKAKSELKAPVSVYGTDGLYGYLAGGKKIAVSGNVPSGATLLNRWFSLNRLSTIAQYDKAFVTASYYADSLPENARKANAYSATQVENTLFVTLNTSKGYVQSGTDWGNLGTALMGSCPNIVITAELAPDQMGAYDKDMLKSMMEQAAKLGKRIFYVSSGETSGMKPEGGVRYITCGNVADYKTTNMTSNAKTCTYVVFSVSGDDIRFEFTN